MFCAQGAKAETFDYSNAGALTNAYAKTMIETVGIAADHRSLSPATPLGMVIGLDVGVVVSGVVVPDEFNAAMNAVGNSQTIPSLLPLPRLLISKGLPLGIDLGASWVGYDGNSILGGEVKWAFLDNAALPTLAARVGYTKAEIAFLETKTWKFDVVASKKFAVIDPYVGLGMQAVSGTVNFPAGDLSPGVESSQSTTAGHVYIGLPLTLAVLRFAAEYDMSFAGYNTFSTKFALSF